jgi:hypothetical protein|tara:strand:- start:2483 stop:3022 length:540 start_codon:yes stop_codon:yes gene_type:complete
MDNTNSNNLNVILQNFEKQNNINNNIFSRNLSNVDLEPQVSFRPSSTKYQVMPILENKEQNKNDKKNYELFNTNNIFYPGTTKPHFNGFAKGIDRESVLRNQFFALQKGDQYQYIPSSWSNLYNIDNFPNTLNDIDDNNLNKSILFRQERFDEHNPNLFPHIGNDIFNNNTRYQLNSIQ